MDAALTHSADARVPLSIYREAAALYYAAQRFSDMGDLERCRDHVERALLVFLNATDAHTVVAEVNPSSPFSSNSVDTEEDASRHTTTTATRAAPVEAVDALFANLLLLLSLVYSAAWAYQEADRLLASAGCYARERLHAPDLAMAAIGYNRAVLRLDQVRLSDDAGKTADMALVHEAQERFLKPAAAYLMDVVGPGRLLLSDVLHCLATCDVLQGRWVSAMRHYQRSLDVRVRSYTALERTLRKRHGSGAPSDVDGGTSAETDLDALRPHLPRQDVTELRLALTLAHMAQLYSLMVGEKDAQQHAIRCLNRAVKTRRQWLGPRHPLVLDTYAALAVAAVEAGELGTARAAVQEIIDKAPADDARRIEEARAYLTQLV